MIIFLTVADLLPYNTEQGLPVTREFLLKIIEILLEFVRQTNDRNCKVLDFHHPNDMRRLLDLDIPDRPVTLQQLVDDCCITLKTSTLLQPAVLRFGPGVDGWRMVDRHCQHQYVHLRDCSSLYSHGARCDGEDAGDHRFPRRRLHTRSRGRMIPSELERLILERKAKGHIPFFVNATAGTTVLGAFDPIEPIADICQKYKLWLHIDAAWGGGLLLSRKYRHPKLSGIERSDSVTWNPHKLMGALLQCSTVHFKEDMTPILKGRMMTAGTLMVGYQPDDVRPNFFRNIISSAAVTESDIDFLLAELDRLGHDL
ncbi:hypothetical protein C0J52_10612 [Blattella germanica]|nr:hypothetical protein C0J52_10612 [Blattella germanica]